MGGLQSPVHRFDSGRRLNALTRESLLSGHVDRPGWLTVFKHQLHVVPSMYMGNGHVFVTETGMTWHDIAARLPEFVQWVVATYGPLPDGEAKEADYERYASAYAEFRAATGR